MFKLFIFSLFVVIYTSQTCNCIFNSTGTISLIKTINLIKTEKFNNSLLVAHYEHYVSPHYQVKQINYNIIITNNYNNTFMLWLPIVGEYNEYQHNSSGVISGEYPDFVVEMYIYSKGVSIVDYKVTIVYNINDTLNHPIKKTYMFF